MDPYQHEYQPIEPNGHITYHQNNAVLKSFKGCVACCIVLSLIALILVAVFIILGIPTIYGVIDSFPPSGCTEWKELDIGKYEMKKSFFNSRYYLYSVDRDQWIATTKRRVWSIPKKFDLLDTNGNSIVVGTDTFPTPSMDIASCNNTQKTVAEITHLNSMKYRVKDSKSSTIGDIVAQSIILPNYKAISTDGHEIASLERDLLFWTDRWRIEVKRKDPKFSTKYLVLFCAMSSQNRNNKINK